MSIKLEENNLSKINFYRPEIDGLRAFAVLTVIINHLNHDVLPGGYLGVDIFFVISGFVISSSIDRRSTKNFLDFISGFYVRRIKRLIPALVFFLIITSILTCIVNPSPGYSLWLGIYSLFGVSNFELVKTSTDYFAPAEYLNVFMHTWSLSLEEQFYFLFPLLTWLTGFSRPKRNGDNNLLIVILIFSVFSLITFIHFYQSNQIIAYYLIPFRFWELSSGCIIYLLLKKRIFFIKILEKIPPILIIILMIGIMFLPLSFAIISTISMVILTIFLLLGLNEEKFLYKILSQNKVVYIGSISYSLYLWHYGIISLSNFCFENSLWLVLWQIILTFLIASISHKYIEKPFREMNWGKEKWKTLIYGLSTLITSMLVILIIKSYSIRRYLYSSKYPLKSFISIQHLHKNKLKNDLRIFDKNKDSKAIYVYGDSHGFNLFPSLKSIGKKYGFQDFIECVFHNQQCNRLDDNNQAFNKDLLFSNEDLIFFSERAYFNDEKKLRINIEYLINLVRKSNSKLILVDDLTPFGDRHNPDFFSKFSFFRDGPVIARSIAEEKRNKHTNILLSYIDNINVFYIDPLPEVCELNECSAIVNGQLIYADGSPHFNTQGASILNELWDDFFPRLLDNKYN